MKILIVRGMAVLFLLLPTTFIASCLFSAPCLEITSGPCDELSTYD